MENSNYKKKTFRKNTQTLDVINYLLVFLSL